MPLGRRGLLVGLIVLPLALLSRASDRWELAGPLPERIDDRQFWRMITEFSEVDGYFRSDNLISNEATYPEVIPTLKERAASGGVYLGVGPDQNFSYIVALEPRLAFIIDIRRQNMLLHLLYKAVLERSPDRAAFLSRLFSRPPPKHLDKDAPPSALFDHYHVAEPDPAAFRRNLRDALDLLTGRHGFALGEKDRQAIEYVYRAFFEGGPNLRYSFPRRDDWGRFPSYAELQTATDDKGIHYGYLASERAFRVLKDLEAANRLIPIVGDFAGDRAIRAVGRYLKDHGATVSAFYTSNVEQYLFRSGQWHQFIENVAQLPTDDRSTFIRAYFGFGSGGYFGPGFGGRGSRSTLLLDPIAALVADVREGNIQTYGDLGNRAR